MFKVNTCNTPSFEGYYPPTFSRPIKQTKIIEKLKNLFYQFAQKMIGFFIVPGQLLSFFTYLGSKRCYLIQNRGGKLVKLKTPDQITIEGMHFLGKNLKESDRTVIFFNGNGHPFEKYGKPNLFHFDPKSWQKRNWNVFVFNYRGTGRSQGRATQKGLILDGLTAVQYVSEKLNVPLNKCLLHGHSLGAGIASHVATFYPSVNYCNDRSFKSLNRQIRGMFGEGKVQRFANRILTYLGWELNSDKNWELIKGKKFYISHLGDHIIPKKARFNSPNNFSIQMDEEAPFLTKRVSRCSLFRKMFFNLFTAKGMIAHLRKYNTNETQQYFDFIANI